MSKENNLTDFLTDVADAIREKKGTTDLINPQDFSSEILSIESGSKEVEEKDINFYDYDGTLLFSYTIPEAQALTELPTPKGHSGLVFDGWNWDYEDVIALDYPMDIGAMYRTDDGKTRFYLEVEDEEGVDINLQLSNSGTLEIDFGDGNTSTTSDSEVMIPHTYNKGKYVLTLESLSGFYVLETAGITNIFGSIAANSCRILTKIEIGTTCRLGTSGLMFMTNLAFISTPKVLSNNSNFGWKKTCYGCLSLRHINIPMKSSYIQVECFSNCASLHSIAFPSNRINLVSNAVMYSALSKLRVSDISIISASIDKTQLKTFRIPKAVTVVRDSIFNACYYLQKVELHDNIAEIKKGAFYECVSLEEIAIPSLVTAIPDNCFYRCYLLRNVVFPEGLTSLGASSFFYCKRLQFLDMSRLAQIPTLANTNAFSYTTLRIVVPDALYDEWIAATNWSTYADRIIKASEYQSNNE